MAITVGASATAQAFSTQVSVAKPSGAVAGDTLLFVGVTQGAAQLTSDGWTVQATAIGHSGVAPCRITVSLRRLTTDDNDTSSWTFSNGSEGTRRLSGTIVCLSGVSELAPIHVQATASGPSGGSPVAPSVSPTIDDGLLVCCFAAAPRYNDQGTCSLSEPAGLTSAGYTGSSYACGRIAYAQLSSDGPTGTHQATGNGVAWAAVSLVLSDNAAPDAPSAVTFGANIIAAQDDNTLTWVHSDPDGDPEADAEIRWRQIGGDWTVESRTAPGECEFPGDTFFAGDHEVQVRTADAEGYGPWSASLFYTAALRPEPPTIVDPEDQDTITGPTHTVEMSHDGSPSAMRLRVVSLDEQTVYWASPVVPWGTTFDAQFPAATNGETVLLQAEVRADGLWSGWAEAEVDVVYTPPPAAIPAVTPDSPEPGALGVSWIIPDPQGGEPAVDEVRVWRRQRHRITGDWGPAVRVAVGLDPDADNPWVDWAVASRGDYDYRLETIAANGTTAMSDWSQLDSYLPSALPMLLA